MESKSWEREQERTWLIITNLKKNKKRNVLRKPYNHLASSWTSTKHDTMSGAIFYAFKTCVLKVLQTVAPLPQDEDHRDWNVPEMICPGN